MNDVIPFTNDFTLRVRVLSHIMHDVCRCHLFTNPLFKCSRCEIVKTAQDLWPYEYDLVTQAITEINSEV